MNEKEGCYMFKRMLKTLLNVILFLCLLALSYLIMIRGITIEEAHAKTELNISDLEKFSNYTKEDVHKVLDGILKEKEIPTTIIDEILENEEQKQVIDNYVEEAITSAKQGKELPSIPTDKIETILTTEIEKYNEKNNTNISVSKVKGLVNDFTKKVEPVFNFVNQNITLLSSFRFIFNDTVYYSLLAITLILILIIAVIYKKEAIFSFGGISIFNGLMLFITFIVLKSDQLKNILEFLPINLTNLKNSFFTSSIIFLVTGILLFILYRGLLMYEEKKRQKHKVISNKNEFK